MNSTPDPSSTLVLAMRMASSRIEELEAENRSLKAVITSLEERLKWYVNEQPQKTSPHSFGLGFSIFFVGALYTVGIAALVYFLVR